MRGGRGLLEKVTLEAPQETLEGGPTAGNSSAGHAQAFDRREGISGKRQCHAREETRRGLWCWQLLM